MYELSQTKIDQMLIDEREKHCENPHVVKKLDEAYHTRDRKFKVSTLAQVALASKKFKSLTKKTAPSVPDNPDVLDLPFPPKRPEELSFPSLEESNWTQSAILPDSPAEQKIHDEPIRECFLNHRWAERHYFNSLENTEATTTTMKRTGRT